MLEKTRTQVIEELRHKGVGSQVLYIPVHLQPWYKKSFGYGIGKNPVAERMYPSLLSLPLYPSMVGAEIREVVDAVRALK